MLSLPLPYVVLANVFAALATHGWLRNHEPSSMTLTAVSLLSLSGLVAFVLRPHMSSLFQTVLFSISMFLGTLTASIVTYRLSPFHPLAKYPGPVLCKVSKLWGVVIALTGKTHLVHKRLHERYGPVVRIGPNELSIVDKDLIPLILGRQGMPKGPLWEGRRFYQEKYGPGYDSLIDVRNLDVHAQLRKPWNKAFANAPLKDYEELLVPRVKQFGDELERLCQASPDGFGHVDLARWMSFFAFDFMGDIAFGGCFELMRDGDQSGFWRAMEGGLFAPSVLQHIPWFGGVIRSIPMARRGVDAFIAFGLEQANRRANLDLKKKDFFFYLLDAADADISQSLHIIVSNVLLTIVAGSDTTASVLSNLFYFLLCNPAEYARLQSEIDEAFPQADSILANADKLAFLSLLNAVINEALRLQPAVPSSLQRAPALGSGGKQLGNMFIPEGTAVQVPPYVLHRDPRYFSPNPEVFWPDRWIKQNEKIVVERAAFIPFSYGPANCAGRPLAMTEMRLVVAFLVKKFDMAFEDGFNPKDWEKDLRDRFVIAKGKLPAKIWLR